MYQTKANQNDGSLNSLVAKIEKEVNARGTTLVDKKQASLIIGMENFTGTARNEVMSSFDRLTHALESISKEFQDELTVSQEAYGQMQAPGAMKTNMSGKFTAAQKMAGNVAAMISGDIKSYLGRPVQATSIPVQGVNFVPAMGGDAMAARTSTALEAYDERETRASVVYAVAYNMQAARQDEFGEAFFPTIIVTPDQYGYSISIRLVQVMDEVRRQISGEISRNFEKKNIIHALIDPTILRNDQTKIIPVYNDQSKEFFVNPALVPPAAILHEGQSITTAPMAIGKKFSILGLSQTAALLETGLMDSTDAIDPAVQLASLYMSIGTEVFKFGTVAQMTAANFTYAVQGNYRQMNLHFDTNNLPINKNSKLITGADSVALKALIDLECSVKLSVLVSGSVNLELADTSLISGDIGVYEIRDKAGNVLDLKTGQGKTFAALFATAKIFGYDLNARRTNTNRRERGQLLDLTFYNTVYGIPLLAPITVPRPMTSDNTNDSSDLGALITATHIRTSNAAVAKLLEAEAVLRDWVTTNGGAFQGDSEILGVSRHLVKPFYEFRELDMVEALDSIKSSDRMRDVQAVIVNLVRDMALRMYRDSGYKPVADSLSGGVAPVPTVIIGTDPVIAGYLDVVGDFRTLGNSFQVRVVQTMNLNMKGKIRMSFGEFADGKDGQPNPLHFGNMAWKPEIVVVLPLHRNGANNKEITVQPSFLHVVNLPIMSSINVLRLEEVVASKILIKTQEVPVVTP